MSDVYDSPAWQKKMGPVGMGPGVNRIGLLFCVDGIPAFQKGHCGLEPAEYIILSLPPVERVKPANMLLQLLVPDHLKPEQQRKYFDFIAHHEMLEVTSLLSTCTHASHTQNVHHSLIKYSCIIPVSTELA